MATSDQTTTQQNPHLGQPVIHAGADLSDAKAVAIMIHGRGANARDILSLASEFHQKDIAYLAPQAYGNTWYPFSFLEPLERNEPGITSGLGAINRIAERLELDGFSSDKIMLLGFSQGGCLALEYAARNARRYGGVVGLSAGLIGPQGTPRDYPGSMSGTPVFVGCDEQDFHIPQERVHETAEVFGQLEADVTKRLYSNMGHSINSDEIGIVQSMLNDLI